MKKILISAFLVVLPVISFAKLTTGYGNTEWGMTPAQVISAEKGRAKLVEPMNFHESYGRVQISDIDLGSVKYTATFLFDKNDKLIQTNLTSGNVQNEYIINSNFEYILENLTHKYGKPDYSGPHNASWKTKETTIQLKRSIDKRLSISEIFIRYVPNSTIAKTTSNL